MRKAEREHERAQKMGAKKELAMVKRQLAAIGKSRAGMMMKIGRLPNG